MILLKRALEDVDSPELEETDHSKFWYFIVISIELLVLFGLIAVTNYTVKYRSGLNEPDRLRRIWARAPEIRFQPVIRPMIFAVCVSYGAQTVFHVLISVFLSFIYLNERRMPFIGLVVSIISVGSAAVISVLIYRAAGGTNIKGCILATIAFDWVLEGLLLPAATGIYQMLGDGIAVYFIFSIAFLVVMGLIQFPFFKMGIDRKLPPTAMTIYNSSIVPNWVKLDRTILIASPILLFVYVVAYICEVKLNCDTYLSNVTLSLASLMMLAASALVSILSVNRALLANEFQWQWRSFLTPAIPAAAMKAIAMLFRFIFGDGTLLYTLWAIVHFSLSCGSCGTIGAYVYMKLAELYAQEHIDDEMMGQDDLLAEFDEDEDNEELDI